MGKKGGHHRGHEREGGTDGWGVGGREGKMEWGARLGGGKER